MQHLKNVENILVLDDGKIKMRGSYDELKQQGLDFNEMLRKYEGNKEASNADDIFEDDDSENSDQEEQKNCNYIGTNDDDDKEDDTLRLPPIKDAINSSKNFNDPNETEEPINASARVYPIHETEGDLIETKEKSKEINYRSIMAFREIGKGHSAIKTFAAVMNMPQL